MFVIDPRDEHVTATQPGAMSLQELKAVPRPGGKRRLCEGQYPADAALARGDTLRTLQPQEAVKPIRKRSTRLRPLGPSVTCRSLLVGALQDASHAGVR